MMSGKMWSSMTSMTSKQQNSANGNKTILLVLDIVLKVLTPILRHESSPITKLQREIIMECR